MKTDDGQPVRAFILINLATEHVNVTEIRAVLEPLDIPVAAVETGRRLHWTTALVIGVPEHRLTDAILALDAKGFCDVLAFHGEPDAAAPGGDVPVQ